MADLPKLRAYEGKDNYIFISYSHSDRETVYPFIAALQKNFNVWFDEGIHYGNEWEEEIAEKLERCSVFIFMITKESLASKNCKDELYNARELEKNFINVLVDKDADLPGWFKLRYGRYQMCKYYTFSSPDDATEDLERKCSWFSAARKIAGSAETPEAKNTAAPRESAERTKPQPQRTTDGKTAEQPIRKETEKEPCALQGNESGVPERKKRSDIYIGSVIRFGRFPQKTVGAVIKRRSSERDPIEWQVLDIRDNRVLVISKNALDRQQYDAFDGKTSWKTCSLRKWLNDTFLNTAFSSEEQDSICNTVNMTSVSRYQTRDATTETTDKILLLSIAEAKSYFHSDEARKCAPTDYAAWHKEQRLYTTTKKTGCNWWLRSPGYGYRNAACVDSDGIVDAVGSSETGYMAVRPAMWIDIGAAKP